MQQKKKIRECKKMMKEGVKSRKQMTGTGRAFQFEGSKSYHAIRPGDKELYGKQMKVEKTKKFKTAKEIEKRNESSKDFFETQVEKRNKASKKAFMGGGMAGRRFGYKGGKLVGKQKNIDVAAPFGKITGADFKKLRKK